MNSSILLKLSLQSFSKKGDQRMAKKKDQTAAGKRKGKPRQEEEADGFGNKKLEGPQRPST
jgi:hypothetical protein